MKSLRDLRFHELLRSAVSKVLPLLILSLLARTAQAITVTWSATPTNGNWSVGANWAGGVAPNPGDDLVFPATSTIQSTTNDLAAGIAITSITFAGNGYTVAGNSITLAGGALPYTVGCTTAAAPVNDTVSLPIVAAGAVLLKTVAGCSLTVSGAISGGAGSVVALGAGPVILSGTDSYTGSTTTGLGGGSLIVDGTLSGTSEVRIQASVGTSTLGGNGTTAAFVNVLSSSPGATVSLGPGQGSSTAILNTGDLTLGFNSSLIVKLNGTTVGTEYDQVNVGGSASLDAGPTLDVASLGFLPPNGTTFTILSSTGGDPISGTFAGLPEGATFVKNTTTFQISYAGGAGHDVVLTVVPAAATPMALAVDAGGNGVLEEGEVAAVQPTWMNTSGASVHLVGTTANFAGPAGATYVNPDANGDYGTIADGASAQCADCYTVQITAASRPIQHWDATIDETVDPGSVLKTWTLHVGESFPDVPTSQQFYKFIENLFHNRITGGCAGGNYCPADPVTRAQMAVFLLKSEHHSTYTPPACTATVFFDEPCPGGPFVDWVNQLHTENITGGCGSGNYCPTQAVTRGQMAVFLLKTEHGGAYVPPACSATVFNDVVCPGAQFVDFINQLHAENISGGCGGGNYCPTNPNNRGQMAVFLVKTFGLTLYGP